MTYYRTHINGKCNCYYKDYGERVIMYDFSENDNSKWTDTSYENLEHFKFLLQSWGISLDILTKEEFEKELIMKELTT